ncbi:ABC transporter ATP-binding protein [Oligoflexus tunisiensis]|uniref:ABC transporter ATP-binding protein n=1 Tax=Oligoflexus tunisiensis TaxID=708132 RepID=UPI000AA14158|nr:ABC transporter ATP-binding protein [Oligoflexus tunisiensis]
MSEVKVEAQNLSVRFGDFFAVKDLSLSVQQGEIFGFLGANGAGKTTTIRVLCGLLPPSSGTVRVAGAEYSGGQHTIKAKVGYMSQKFTLYNDLSVQENLDFAACLRKLDPKVYATRRNRLLEFIGFSRDPHTMVRDLAGGLKQQVSLIASLLHDPEIIFLDEPTAGVSPAARARFWSLIRELQGQGKTIFVTTHYMDEAENCGRIALMRSGELIALDNIPSLKRTAFPEPIIELEPRNVALSREELQHFRKMPGVRSIQPHGIRYHAVTESRAAWEKVREEFSKRFDQREIQPSLEDVFIELVEGKDRRAI